MIRFFAKHPTAGNLAGIAVGQVVGMMNTRQPAKQVVYDMVNEYVDTVGRVSEELANAAE